MNKVVNKNKLRCYRRAKRINKNLVKRIYKCSGRRMVEDQEEGG